MKYIDFVTKLEEVEKDAKARHDELRAGVSMKLSLQAPDSSKQIDKDQQPASKAQSQKKYQELWQRVTD